MKMPFGKHKGEPVASLPLPYCRWLNKNVSLRGELAEAIAARLGRQPANPVRTTQPTAVPVADPLDGILGDAETALERIQNAPGSKSRGI